MTNKLCMSISNEMSDVIIDMAKRDETTKAATVRRAIMVYRHLKEAQNNGAKVIIEHDGRALTEVFVL